jgi:PRTRC genetic system protein E
MDGDLVSETNCTATVSVSDIGQNKATVLVNRINLFWGTRWTAIPSHFHARSFDRHQDRCPDLVIGCVDTGARKAIVDAFAPLTVTGTAEELDRDLPATVVNFVSAHLELKNTLDRARAEMDTAAQAEARSKSKTQPTKVAAKPEPKASESANPIPQTPSESPRVASLFDSPEPAPRPGLDEEKEIPAEHQGEFREEVDEDEAA